LILLLIAPAIVVPAVVLLGFAGCNEGLGLQQTTVFATLIDAVAKSDDTITLTWSFGGDSQGFPAAAFLFQRTDPTAAQTFFEAAASPFDDTGLESGAGYQYRVRPVRNNGTFGDWSALVTAATFLPTFQQYLPGDDPGWQSYTLVQRIEAPLLSVNGATIQITVRAASTGGASIDRIYISQLSPSGDPYDSGSDLTKVYDSSTDGPPIAVPANTSLPLAAIGYNLDHNQPLLIAADFSAAPPSAIAYVEPVPASDAVAYYHQGAEAALSDRSVNYVSTDRIYLIEKISIG